MSAQNGLQHIKTKQKTTQTHALFQNPFDICDGSGVCKINARFTCTPDAFLTPPAPPEFNVGPPPIANGVAEKTPVFVMRLFGPLRVNIEFGGAGV